MFTASVYRVMIGSLSGTMEEVFSAKEVVRKYNQENAESTGKLFLPVEWTTRNEEIQNVDVVIGIVGNWIEKSAFIQDCVNAGKRVLLFFNAFQDPKNTIQSEHDEVEAFRERVQDRCQCLTYSNATEMKQLIEYQLNTI